MGGSCRNLIIRVLCQLGVVVEVGIGLVVIFGVIAVIAVAVVVILCELAVCEGLCERGGAAAADIALVVLLEFLGGRAQVERGQGLVRVEHWGLQRGRGRRRERRGRPPLHGHGCWPTAAAAQAGGLPGLTEPRRVGEVRRRRWAGLGVTGGCAVATWGAGDGRGRDGGCGLGGCGDGVNGQQDDEGLGGDGPLAHTKVRAG